MKDSKIQMASLSFSGMSEHLRPYLQQIGMNSSVAEAHGLFSGIICVDPNKQKKYFWFELLDLAIDEQNVLSREARDEVDLYYQTIEQALNSDELDFQLAIDEEDSLMDRIEDLSIWVQSFLYGLGLNQQSLSVQGSEDVKDFIKDLIEISHAEDYDLSSEDQGEEDNEKSLFELIEYVRMGVLLVYQEFCVNPDLPVNGNKVSQEMTENPDFDREQALGSSLFH